MSSEGRGFVTATKDLTDTPEKLYAEISIYVRAPDGYIVNEAELEAGLETAVADAFNKAVLGHDVGTAPVEVTNPAAVKAPNLELPADSAEGA